MNKKKRQWLWIGFIWILAIAGFFLLDFLVPKSHSKEKEDPIQLATIIVNNPSLTAQAEEVAPAGCSHNENLMSSGTWNAISATFTHTTSSNDDRLLVVTVGLRNGGAEVVEYIEYNGVTLTRSTASQRTFGSIQTFQYYLANAATGSNDLLIQLSGGVKSVYSAQDLDCSDTASPKGNTDAKSTLSSTDQSITATSATGEICIDGLTVQTDQTGTASAYPGQSTHTILNDALNNITLLSSSEPGAASVTMGWTYGTSSRSESVMTCFKEKP